MVRYRCVSCGRELEADTVVYLCPHCSRERDEPAAFPRGCLSVIFAGARAGRIGGEADVQSFLPLPMTRRGELSRRGTPRWCAPRRLRRKTGLSDLWLKNDTLNPSGSLKDRASALVAEQALALGERRVVLASTGNAGASMACVGRGLRAGGDPVRPRRRAAGKAPAVPPVRRARVVPVKGTYDDAFALSIAWTTAFGGINRNTAFNPFTVEGKKTVSIEIYNQLGREAPRRGVRSHG